jgi:hypothetical protein
MSWPLWGNRARHHDPALHSAGHAGTGRENRAQINLTGATADPTIATQSWRAKRRLHVR